MESQYLLSHQEAFHIAESLLTLWLIKPNPRTLTVEPLPRLFPRPEVPASALPSIPQLKSHLLQEASLVSSTEFMLTGTSVVLEREGG